MPITVDLDQDRIDVGETKRLSVTPRAPDGTAITPASLTLDGTEPDGTALTQQTLADFSTDGDAYLLFFTFDAVGVWTMTLAATDSSGNTEKLTFQQRVQ